MNTERSDLICEDGILSAVRYLECRIQDLKDRLMELDMGEYGSMYREYGEIRLRKEDLEYMLPEYIFSSSDIETAISIARAELKAITSECGEIGSQVAEDKIHLYKRRLTYNNEPELAA